VLAFSPGFLVAPWPAGRPRVFVSHGTADRILPIEAPPGAHAPEEVPPEPGVSPGTA
jgi:predicted esterase